MRDPFDDPEFAAAWDRADAERQLDEALEDPSAQALFDLEDAKLGNPGSHETQPVFDPVQDAADRLDDPNFALQVEEQFVEDTFADRLDFKAASTAVEDQSGLDTKHPAAPSRPKPKKKKRKRKKPPTAEEKKGPRRRGPQPVPAPPPPPAAAFGRGNPDIRFPPGVHPGSRRLTLDQLIAAQSLP